MTSESLPDGPDLEALLQLLRDEFPDAVVATLIPLIAQGHDRLAARRNA